MRILSILIVLWLIIGAIAAVTILAGPLNYVGANPKVRCALPQPSK